ncbi:MAG TPA: hypothetical protein VG537_09575 [Candidatus Kapabacteria bacterium]|nr:hypothetical protein [Candidatus Kapabacteria bacterium]
MLPIVLVFLLLLEQVALPHSYKMHGSRKYIAWGLCGIVMLFGIYTAGKSLIDLIA